MKIFAFMI